MLTESVMGSLFKCKETNYILLLVWTEVVVIIGLNAANTSAICMFVCMQASDLTHMENKMLII